MRHALTGLCQLDTILLCERSLYSPKPAPSLERNKLPNQLQLYTLRLGAIFQRDLRPKRVSQTHRPAWCVLHQQLDSRLHAPLSLREGMHRSLRDRKLAYCLRSTPGPLHQHEALEQREELLYEVGASAEKQLQIPETAARNSSITTPTKRGQVRFAKHVGWTNCARILWVSLHQVFLGFEKYC